MNQEVLTEIHRINQIMFLNESVSVGATKVIKSLKKFIESYDRKAIENLSKEGNVLPNVKKIISKTGDDLNRSLNNLLSKMDVDKLAKVLVGDGFGNKNRRQLISDLVDKLNQKKSVKEKIKVYQEFSKKQSELYSDVFNKMKIDGLESFNDLVDKLRFYNQQTFNNNLKKSIGDDIFRQLVTKPMTKSEKFTNFLNREFGSNLTSIRRYIARSLTSQEKLNQEFINVLEQSFNTKQIGQTESFYIEKLTDILAAKKKGVNDDLKNMLGTIKRSLSNKTDATSIELSKYLDDILGDNDILKKLNEIADKSQLSLGGELRNVLDKYRNMLWPIKGESGKRLWKEMFQRQMMFIINANPNLPNEIYSQLLKQGFPRTVAIRIVNAYIAKLIIYPIIYGLWTAFKSILHSIGNLFSKEEIQSETKTFTDYLTDAFPMVSGKYWKLFPFSTFIPEFVDLVSDVWNFVNKSTIWIRNWVNGVIGSGENDVEEAERALTNIKNGGQNPQPLPVQQNFTDDENGLIKYLRTINKEYKTNSYLKAEGEYPSEGQDTEYNMYYFKNNKWDLAN